MNSFLLILLGLSTHFVIVQTINYILRLAEEDKLHEIVTQEVLNAGGYITTIKETEYWVGKHRRNYTFEVYFIDIKQQSYIAECLLDSSLIGGVNIRWRHTPALLIHARHHPAEQNENEVWTPKYIYADEPGKELLLDCLNSVYRYERLATIIRISEMASPDKVLITKIKELADNDPVYEVAQAAQDYLRSLPSKV